ncbi:MAG: FdhF/YdeP family oxidoreductase, partial [Gemmatimonadota bacterium]
HLCMVRLNLLRLNTMGSLDPDRLADVRALQGLAPHELRELGRLPCPMAWRRGEPGYRRISWDEAEEIAAGKIREVVARDPDRLSFYLTSRGLANEVYFAFQKVARFLGTNNIDNSARLCHAPSTSGLQKTIGYGATTIPYTDWIGTDLLILVGTNLANNQPVATKYIYLAKKAGTRVVVVNPYLEEGLDRYWIPSAAESALFGTRIADEHFAVQQGGDAAFFTGALKHLVERDRLDHEFIRAHSVGFDELAAHVRRLDWAALERDAGLPAGEIRRFAELYADADTSVTVWSMGITQHRFGTQNVFALSNLALSLGRIGRPRCGLNPIRGHSGVQGGAEMGAVPGTVGMGNPVGDEAVAARLRGRWGFHLPARPGLSATAAIEAMHDGRIDLLWCVGGDFLHTLPDPDYTREALGRVPVRIFQDLVPSPMMLLEPPDVNLILPGATRYETPGGVTETTTERRVIFSPEIPGRRIGEARPEWEIPTRIAARVFPERAARIRYAGTAEIRADIGATIAAYGPILGLAEKGDHFQWGGARLCVDGRFGTPDGKGHFVVPELPREEAPEGWFRLATRRGKQFNTMVWGDADPLTGARRDDVFVSAEDAARLGLRDGAPVLVRSPHGEMRAKARVSRIAAGSVQVHWPEGNALIAPGVTDAPSGEPDYNTTCEIVPLTAPDDQRTGPTTPLRA